MKKNTSLPIARPGNGSRLNGGELDVKQLLAAMVAVKRGDFSARLPDDWTGIAGKIADTFNELARTNLRMTQELERIGRVVGKDAVQGRFADFCSCCLIVAAHRRSCPIRSRVSR